MQVTVLGSGSAMPTGKRMQTGLLLDRGETAMLVDCGSGALHRLAETSVGYSGIDGLLLTHHHLDHVSDVMPLLKARWLDGATEFTVAGPPGTEALLDGLFDVHEYMQDRLDLTVTEVEPGSFELVGFEVHAIETRHSMYCLAYRFEGEDGAFTFSGDSEAFEDLAAFADGSDVLLHDCSFPDEVDVSNHPTPSKLGAVLQGHDYGTVYLTHLYPHTEGNHRQMLDSIDDHYDGEVRFARDGLTVEV